MKIGLIVLLITQSTFALNYQWHKKSCLDNVVKSIKQLPNKGEAFVLTTDGFFSDHEYKNTFRNKLGIDNHFQGITYHPKNNIIVLSGANKNNKSASLFIIEKTKKPTLKLRYNIEIEDDLWHVGGIAFAEDILVLPMERFKPSKIASIHFLSFKDWKKVSPFIKSQKISDNKAGSADLLFDPIQKRNFLFAFDTKEIKLFQSTITSIDEGFDFLSSIKTKIFAGSNMKTLQQCDGEIYLANLTNTGLLPPILNSENELTLYHFNLEKKSLDQILKKTFECGKDCNFRGAASLVTEDNNLTLISSKMYRESKNNQIKFKIFHTPNF